MATMTETVNSAMEELTHTVEEVARSAASAAEAARQAEPAESALSGAGGHSGSDAKEACEREDMKDVLLVPVIGDVEIDVTVFVDLYRVIQQMVSHVTIEPDIFGVDLFRIGESATFAVIGDVAICSFLVRFAGFIKFARR